MCSLGSCTAPLMTTQIIHFTRIGWILHAVHAGAVQVAALQQSPVLCLAWQLKGTCGPSRSWFSCT